MVRRDLLDLGQGGDVLEFFAEEFGVGEGFGIGHEAGAERTDGLVFAAPFFYG